MKSLFKKDNVIHCKLEDFWDTVKYQEEWDNGVQQRNVYRIEDHPTCSCFKKIKFKDIKKGDYIIILTSILDYMGPNSGYGSILKASGDVFKAGDTFGVKLESINMPQCWTEEAFEKHMILSGGEYHGPSGHYKNGVKIG
jgi:hypothetical protein